MATVCSGWQLAALLWPEEGADAVMTVDAQGHMQLDMAAVQVLPLLDPVSLRILRVRHAGGGDLPAVGGLLSISLNIRSSAASQVAVALHTSPTSGSGIPCEVSWAHDYLVQCTAPPGAGTVYVSLAVDGQAAEQRMPLAYEDMLDATHVDLCGS
jgi:hypothetical protein